MRKNFLAFILVLALLMAGCGGVTSPVSGSLYTNLKGPGYENAAGEYSKVGEAECTGYLGLVAVGDCSVETAARNGGLSTVKFVDYKAHSILGIVNTYTTVVYGD
ncbi:MAG: TRL-like family protein [Desulfovibrionaceae bacterium]|nr:TRL-like family protein [Desulfovibrionaceae bacterium]